jgi:hypothetical protein
MERGTLVGKLRARFGDRLATKYGVVSIDTNGDDVEVFYREDQKLFKVEGTIVELGSGQHVSYSFETLDALMDAIDRLIEIDGPMPSVPVANEVVAAPEMEKLEQLAALA